MRADIFLFNLRQFQSDFSHRWSKKPFNRWLFFIYFQIDVFLLATYLIKLVVILNLKKSHDLRTNPVTQRVKKFPLSGSRDPLASAGRVCPEPKVAWLFRQKNVCIVLVHLNSGAFFSCRLTCRRLNERISNGML